MSTHEGLMTEPEGPKLLAANIRIGARLLASAVAFFFMAFVFAFFYLSALNTQPRFVSRTSTRRSVGASRSCVCVLGSSARYGRPRAPWATARQPVAPRGLGAFVLALAAIALQFIEYYNLSFGATDGGLASVFFGFTVFFASSG